VSDIKIRWDQGLQQGDFLFSDNDLEMDDGLATAVLISLFTDQLVSDEDEIPNANINQAFIDKRGWWGDLINPDEVGDQIGSKLWLLERSKTDEDSLTNAEEYALTALNWFIDDGIAKDIVVTAERNQMNGIEVLSLLVQIIKVDGNKVNFTFDDLWGATIGSEIPDPVPTVGYFSIKASAGELITGSDGQIILGFTGI